MRIIISVLQSCLRVVLCNRVASSPLYLCNNKNYGGMSDKIKRYYNFSTQSRALYCISERYKENNTKKLVFQQNVFFTTFAK